MRVLHLLEKDCDFQTTCLAEALAVRLGEEFEVDQFTLRSLLPTLRQIREIARQYDLVHSWSLRSLTLAALAGDHRLIFSPAGPLGPRAIGWLRAMMNYRDVHVIPTTATMQRQLVERGIGIQKCKLIRPGVDFGRIQRRRNAALRAELGLDEKDFAILAAGESTRAANHRLAVWSTSVLHVVDAMYKLVIWGHGNKAESVEQFGRDLAQPDMVHAAPRVEYEQLMSVADLVLVTAQESVASLPIMIAMAAGLPIVSIVTPEISELLEDRHSAAMVAKPAPKLIAQRILDVRNDPSLQWNIADRARTEAYDFFPMTKFLNEWREVYRGAR